MHRDLKWDNILVDKYDNLKLSDFDYLRYDRASMSSGGCLAIVAPELWVPDSQYTKSSKSDIWSLSFILLELVTCISPIEFHPAVFAAKMREKWRPVIPETCPTPLSYVIQMCWNEDPNDRPEAAELDEYFGIFEMSIRGNRAEDCNLYNLHIG